MWDWGEFNLRIIFFLYLSRFIVKVNIQLKRFYNFKILGPRAFGGGKSVRVRVKFCGIGRSLS